MTLDDLYKDLIKMEAKSYFEDSEDWKRRQAFARRLELEGRPSDGGPRKEEEQVKRW